MNEIETSRHRVVFALDALKSAHGALCRDEVAEAKLHLEFGETFLAEARQLLEQLSENDSPAKL